ncbi:MAG: tyrosine--tRNA ligase [Patescibacteria group bacterium]|nr:MAG: tyrosine--tRNA ligase [Patescibacteria group bacterium]
MEIIDEILTRGVANIIPSKEELKEVLLSGRKLNIYLGIDPTANKIHLGHAVPLRKLQQFADFGHHVTFLIGDFTSLIGDTSDKESERPILTKEEIEQNFKDYKRQAEKIVDFSKIIIRYNSEWLSQLTLEDIIRLSRHFSVGDFINRELIRKRLQEGKRVRLDEMLYPIMQGYDSYYMDTDLQLGGTDQTFNMQAGRTLQRNLRGKESFIMTNEFLEGTDGRKMSKSWGNAIWLDDEPEEMYTKVMAIPDNLIIKYFTLATNTPIEEIAKIEESLQKGAHPMSIKKTLAFTIVSELHTPEEAAYAQKQFERIVQKGELPSEITEVKIAVKKYIDEDLLVDLKLASSKSEAKRLFQQGGVEYDGRRILDPAEAVLIQDGKILKVGKRKIVKLRIN